MKSIDLFALGEPWQETSAQEALVKEIEGKFFQGAKLDESNAEKVVGQSTENTNSGTAPRYLNEADNQDFSDPCIVCNGTGNFEEQKQIKTKCNSCGGRGYTTKRVGGSFNTRSFDATAGHVERIRCGKCGGEGYLNQVKKIRKKCSQCGGTGKQ